MGHVRLKRLPASKKWAQVVALLADGAPVGDIARASAEASDAALAHARRDATLVHSFWLLTQLPLAARSPDLAAAARALGVDISSEPTLIELVGG
jgi:hypothetical protein